MDEKTIGYIHYDVTLKEPMLDAIILEMFKNNRRLAVLTLATAVTAVYYVHRKIKKMEKDIEELKKAKGE